MIEEFFYLFAKICLSRFYVFAQIRLSLVQKIEISKAPKIIS